ncbi:hypothetical protein A2U01_0003060 [Trifolium medium]|uniref:Uncharacterized protein n=1 Tax=Trifolium medium TaxID=97028 RepID=A0A392M4Q7_9FABA|nr:hypothetical protein [Trifolium medium]
MYEDSVRGFKERYYTVRPISVEGWKTISYWESKRDDNGKELMGPGGVPVEVDYASFPYYWNKSHYDLLPRDLTVKKSDLSPEEAADYKRLEDYVGSFPQVALEDSEGNLIRDENGHQKMVPKLIDTKRLLACKTDEAVAAFFLEMMSAQAKLRQARVAKKKTAEVAGISSSMPSGSSKQVSPAPSIEVVNEKRPREDDLEDTHTSRQHRRVNDVDDPTNSIAAGLHKLTQGVPAARFDYPPAISHDPLFDERTQTTIPAADVAILAAMGPEEIRGKLLSTLLLSSSFWRL